MDRIPRHRRAIYLGVVLFVIFVVLADQAIERFALEGAALVIVALLPVAPLTYWWRQYPKEVAALDEMERLIEARALAWGAGIGLWIVTVWAMLEIRDILPALPLAATAPIVALCYAAARFVIARQYR